MKPHRALFGLVAFVLPVASVACLQDFDVFEGVADAVPTPDAAPGTPDAVADAAPLPPAPDAAAEASTDASADADAGPCTSAPGACLATRVTCRSACNTTEETCTDACPNGASGFTCRQKCNSDQNKCLSGCNDSCRTCGGTCTIGCS